MQPVDTLDLLVVILGYLNLYTSPKILNKTGLLGGESSGRRGAGECASVAPPQTVTFSSFVQNGKNMMNRCSRLIKQGGYLSPLWIFTVAWKATSIGNVLIVLYHTDFQLFKLFREWPVWRKGKPTIELLLLQRSPLSVVLAHYSWK
ncbi:hypothetical protein AMECASPLE_037022 [Ameca splendens]|uniref:Uncharacterized protein n=1 Tax=Ameca splendens TaxID=208324 RepID=A0ABV1A4J3_9TELE